MATPPQHQPQAQYVAGWEINIRRILLLPTRVVYSLHLKFVLYSAPVRGAEYCDKRVYLSV